MELSVRSGLSPQKPRWKRTAFTLVEVALALGIASFGFVAVFGMLPTGMSVFRQGIDTSIGSQIAQRIINEAKQADFDLLLQGSTGAANETFRKPVRYFDDQGNELPTATGALYHVNIRIAPCSAANFTVTQPNRSANLAVVTVQVANNPGNQNLTVTASGAADDQNQPLRNLWDGTAIGGSATVAPLSTWSAYVARNQ